MQYPVKPVSCLALFSGQQCGPITALLWRALVEADTLQLHDWKVCVGLEDGRVFVLPFCVGYVIRKEHLYTEPTNWGMCIAKQAGWEVKQGAELRYWH